MHARKKLNFACKKFFVGKCLFEYKIRFAFEKKNKKKVWDKFKSTFFCRHQKTVVTQFIYTERLFNFCFCLYIAKRQLEKTQ